MSMFGTGERRCRAPRRVRPDEQVVQCRYFDEGKYSYASRKAGAWRERSKARCRCASALARVQAAAWINWTIDERSEELRRAGTDEKDIEA